MKSYKVHFTDGKTLSINSNEKLTIKKLSLNFLPFSGTTENESKVYINTSHIVSIEEHKFVKKAKEKKPKEIVEKKDQENQ